MNTSDPLQATEKRAAPRVSPGWGLAVAFAWIWTWRHLAVEWGSNPQYEYGFAVPFLFVYAARKRWNGPMRPGAGRIVFCLVLVGWLAMVFGEMLRWQDPIWRVTASMLMLGSTLVTAAWFWQRGGWTLLGRERFPLGFAWLGLPWPMLVEQTLTQKLLQWVTALTVAAANLMGIAALQHGNVIELANGAAGMGNACSGAESFQSSLMASLFLGEFYRLSTGRRLALVAAGWGIAFMANSARVLGLVLMIHTKGQAATAIWHDWFGGTASALTFLAIFGAATFFSGKPASGLKAESPDAEFRSGPDWGWGLCLALLAIPLMVEGWFSSFATPDSALPATPRWHLSAESLPADWSWQSRTPTIQERASLQFSQWECLQVKTPEGIDANVIHLFWEPGKNMPSMAFSHTPELCLSSQGWKQHSPPEPAPLNLKGLPVPFVRYSLEQEESLQTVYQSLSSGGKIVAETERPTATRAERLSMLWKEPRRQLDEEVLLYMPTLGDRHLQETAAEQLLDAVLQTGVR